MELSVGTTDPYRLGARKSAIDDALAGYVTGVDLLPVSGITEAPIAEDGISYIWPYYYSGGVTMYKGGEGLYWPFLTTSYTQTVDIDETPYLTMEFQSTAEFNLHLSYRAADGNTHSVTASSLAGISETDFPAQDRRRITLDLGGYIRDNEHADSEGLISLLSCKLYAIGTTDQYVDLTACAITEDPDAPTTITGDYTVENGVLKGVAVGTSAAELIAAMDHSDYLTVRDADGNDVSGTLATGMILCLTVNGNVVDSAVISVCGDVNGDGEATSSDARAILMDCLKGTSELNAAAFSAADMSGEGSLTTTDVRLLLKQTVA